MTEQQRPRAIPSQLPFCGQHAVEGVCRRLAPEDVAPGQYVAVFVRHHDAYRMDERTGRIERQRLTVLPEAVQGEFGPSHPGGPAGAPLEVVAVALPFVVARRVQGLAAPSAPADGEDPADGPPQVPAPVVTLDLRQVSLAEVGQAYARAFTEAHEPEPAPGQPEPAQAEGGGGGDGGDGGGGGDGGNSPRPQTRRARRFRVARWRA